MIALLIWASHAFELKCIYNFEKYGGTWGRIYLCKPEDLSLNDTATVTSISGTHLDKRNSDVGALLIYRETVKVAPAGINKFFNNLKILVIDQGSLTNFDNIRELVGLRRVSLQHNEIEHLTTDSFKGMTSLEDVLLGDNKISTIPAGTFDGLPNLKRLILNKNSLRSLEPNLFKNNLKLEELEFFNNRLSQIDSTVFSSLKSLTQLSLTSNKCIDKSFPSTAPTVSALIGEVNEKCKDSCIEIRQRLDEARKRIKELEKMLE